MKKLLFSLLFFSAIAWLWIGHIIAADGSLNNISGTTTLGGSAITGTALTNNNVNSFILFTNNQISVGFNSSGLLMHTNYAATLLGVAINTNGTIKAADIGIGVAFQSAIGSLSGSLYVDRPSAQVIIISRNNTGTEEWRFSSTGLRASQTGMTLGTDTLMATNMVAFPTNYVAANFAPTAGMVKIVCSNGIFWKVSQLSTQLLDAAQSP